MDAMEGKIKRKWKEKNEKKEEENSYQFERSLAQLSASCILKRQHGLKMESLN